MQNLASSEEMKDGVDLEKEREDANLREAIRKVADLRRSLKNLGKNELVRQYMHLYAQYQILINNVEIKKGGKK